MFSQKKLFLYCRKLNFLSTRLIFKKEIFKNIYNRRLDKMGKLDKKVDCDDIKFIAKSKNRKKRFY